MEYAQDGFTVKGIALKLGVSHHLFKTWLEQHGELQSALDQGRENEHHALFNVLYRAATEKGNTTAAMFLLKSRHGYREGDQTELGNRVSITFNLPGPLSLADYGKVIEHEQLG